MIKRKAYSLDSGPQMNIDGEVDFTAMREKDKRWSKGKSRRENEKGNNLRQTEDRDEWGKALQSMGEYGSADWFMSLLGYQRIWMSKGSGAICYSNVMRLLWHTNILLQLKQKYWYSQEKGESQF